MTGKGLSDADARRGRLGGLSSSSASELHGDSYGVLTRFKDDRPRVFGDDDKLMMESGEPLFRCVSTWPKRVDGRKGPSPSLRWTTYEIVIRPSGTKRLTSYRHFHHRRHLRHPHHINVFLAPRTSCEARHVGEQPAHPVLVSNASSVEALALMTSGPRHAFATWSNSSAGRHFLPGDVHFQSVGPCLNWKMAEQA